MTAYDGQTVAVFGWLGDADGPSGSLASSFRDVPENRKADCLMRLLLVQSDNMYLRPSWWEALEPADQERFVELIMTGTTMRSRGAGNLVDDGKAFLTASVVEVGEA